MTTPITPEAINKLRKYMEPRTIPEIYNILEDLIKENELRKQDTSTHFAAYMKVCDQLKIAKEALEECGEFRKQINPFHEIDDETLDKLTKISDIVDVAISKLTI